MAILQLSGCLLEYTCLYSTAIHMPILFDHPLLQDQNFSLSNLLHVSGLQFSIFPLPAIALYMDPCLWPDSIREAAINFLRKKIPHKEFKCLNGHDMLQCFVTNVLLNKLYNVLGMIYRFEVVILVVYILISQTAD